MDSGVHQFKSSPAFYLLRIFKLWYIHAYMDLMWVTRDLRNCLIYYLSDVILNIAGVTGTLLLAERFEGIGSWTKFQVVFMLGYGIVASGIVYTFFGYNISHISRRLGRGQLDHTLIQPQPIWMCLLTEGFNPFSSSAIPISGLGLMVWAGAKLSLTLSPGWLAMIALNLVASSAIMLSFSFLWGSLAFWAPRGAEEINSSTNRLMDGLRPFPLDGVAPVLLSSMLTVFPIGFVAWYPCRYLLGLDPRAWGGCITPVAAVIFVALTAFFFMRGLKHYGQTGSQRYLSFGHRR
ncbi:MAG: ABC-2 family transporter protein [Candidatus Poribacteria bacterium]|nr:ABC-2 family transporter protein [Candidatus Poribacteria bacterium]